MPEMQVHPIDTGSVTPPFEQVRAQIASRAASGDLPPGTRLPTVRSLAEQLGLAVNTVAKAYRALEADGVIATEGRRGSFIASTTDAGSPEAGSATTAYVATVRRLGLTLPEAVRLIENAWK